MRYDPEAQGAKCSACPLKGSRPVSGEGPSAFELLARRASPIAVIGEAPGEQEERTGRPFCGPSGEELDRALRQAGLDRRLLFVGNVLCCRPPGNDFEAYLRSMSKKAKKEGTEVVSPLECCLPRFLNEVKGFTNFLTLGKTATKVVTGHASGILAVRGGLMTLGADDNFPERRVMPTVHPAFVLRRQRWAHVFRNDVHRAANWFRGQADWTPPEIRYNPTAEELDSFLSGLPFISFDLETDGLDPLSVNTLCVGIGGPEKVMIVGLRGKDGVREFYSPREKAAVLAVLRRYLEDEDHVKVSHNGGYYDRLVLKHNLGINLGANVDTILLHKSVESELPHNLGYVGSIYANAPAWKSDREGRKLSKSAESDEELHEYCALDVAITARVMPKLVDGVTLRDQVSVWRTDTKIQEICAAMHQVGMYVDQAERLAVEKKMLRRRYALIREIRERTGMPKFNPGSADQLRDLLFTKWGLEPPVMEGNEEEGPVLTANGEYTTADFVLRALLFEPKVPERCRDVIKLVRYFRKMQKLLGTYVCKMRPNTMDADLGWDEDETFEDKETREKYGEKRKGIVDASGRMHPGWNAHKVVSGRLSSSTPVNAQNYPSDLRSIVSAAPGHVLVGADMDQLELRVASSVWQVQKYLRAFADGKDPHSMTAFMIFGDEFLAAAGLPSDAFSRPGPLVSPCYKDGHFEGKGVVKQLRHLAKTCQFAFQYGASDETGLQIIKKTEVPATDPNTGKPREDGTTDLPYAQLKLSRVRQMKRKWLDEAPEYKRGWNKELNEFRRVGYLKEPVHGRRRDFLDGEDMSAIVNFKIQGGAAGVVNDAMLELYEDIPCEKWGPGTGIICQVHDQIVVECPESEAEWVKRRLAEVTNRTYKALPDVRLTATPKIGKNWKEV